MRHHRRDFGNFYDLLAYGELLRVEDFVSAFRCSPLVTSDFLVDLKSLEDQADILSILADEARVRLPVVSEGSSFERRSSERLRLMRRHAVLQLERAFSAAVGAARVHGYSSRKVLHRWKKFKAELRHLAVITLSLIAKVQNKESGFPRHT